MGQWNRYWRRSLAKSVIILNIRPLEWEAASELPAYLSPGHNVAGMSMAMATSLI
jgi:hypothetical protein